LNGLRGILALVVLISHYSHPYQPHKDLGYGFDDRNLKATSIMQLPILRVNHSGEAMVPVFLVISGYVLSYKPLKLVSENLYGDMLSSTASAIFRRPFRLFIPSLISSIGVCFLAWRRIFECERYQFLTPTIYHASRGRY
jgi:peptidoglycan/LPS O-acetylase OafA/YrhL